MDNSPSTRISAAQDRGTNRSRRQVLKAAGIGAAACVVPATSANATTKTAASSLPEPKASPRIQKGRTYKADGANTLDPSNGYKYTHSSTLSWHGIQASSGTKEHIFTLETVATTYDNGNDVKLAPEASHFWLETGIYARERYGNDYTIVPYPNTQYQQLFPRDSASEGTIPDMIEIPLDFLIGKTNPVVGAAIMADNLKQSMQPHENMSEYWEPSYGWKGSNPNSSAIGKPGGHVQRFHVEVPDTSGYDFDTYIYSETEHKYAGLKNHWFESVFRLSFPDPSSAPIISQKYNIYGGKETTGIENVVWDSTS
jgi:hypothetical protein